MQFDPRWQQLVSRDRSADGTFFYSVATTGVYCRPSCAARTPNPRNVRFHATEAEAQAAGFRPCLRCRPDATDGLHAGLHAAAIARACRSIETAEAFPDLASLARVAGLSPHHFHRVFKAATGLTPRGYAAAHRAERLRTGLVQAATVTEAVFAAGFNASSRFYDQAPALLGMSAASFRAGGTGQTIRFAVAETSLGALLVAASATGVCAISLGDDPAALLRELQTRFPRADLIGGDGDFEHLAAQVVAMVEQPKLAIDLPLDIRGTAFQQRVWQQLRLIPAGRTASYRAIADAIAAPAAVRAVAAACAANRLAVAIPCHRVVRQTGDLAGYRWGIARKQALLEREADGG